jgi:hypothetical protein
MGEAIRLSEGVFDPTKKLILAAIWDMTAAVIDQAGVCPKAEAPQFASSVHNWTIQVCCTINCTLGLSELKIVYFFKN